MNDLISKLNRYIKTKEDSVTVDKEKIIVKIASVMGLDKEDIKDLTDTFFNDFIKQKELLKSAFENHDYNQANEIAHSIAGASANLRIDEISVPTRALNNLLRDKNSYTESELVQARELIEKILLIDV